MIISITERGPRQVFVLPIVLHIIIPEITGLMSEHMKEPVLRDSPLSACDSDEARYF